MPRCLALLLLTAVVFGCGGKVRSHGPQADGGGGSACITTLACNPGDRCDDGTCVADSDCPAAREPTLLFEAARDSHWANGFAYLVALGGREYLTGGGPDVPTTRGTLFRDLLTGDEHLLDHDVGRVGCLGEPAWCAVAMNPGLVLLWDLELGSELPSWTARSSRALPSHSTLWKNDADFRSGRLVVGGVGAERSIEVVELPSNALLASVPLEDWTLLRVLPRDGQPGHRLVARRSTADTLQVATSSLESHEGWEQIHEGPLAFNFAAAIPDGTDWYVFRDEMPGGTVMQVYRSSSGTSEHLGSSTDRALWALDDSYFSGARALEPGPAAYALTCERGACTSHLVRLAPLAVDAIGTTSIPDDGALTALQIRWLACGAADAVIRAAEGTSGSGEPVRFWSVRIPGRASLSP